MRCSVTQTTRLNGQGSVLYLNASTGAPEGSPVALGVEPAGMAFDPHAGLLYVLSNGRGAPHRPGPVVPGRQPLPARRHRARRGGLQSAERGRSTMANYGSSNITVLNGSTGDPVGPGIDVPGRDPPHRDDGRPGPEPVTST